MPTPSLILVPARFKTGKLYTPVATTSGGVVLGASGDFNVTRATTATRVNASGNIEVVASGIPRLDYFASGGVVGCPALLVEASGTNFVLNSQNTATDWTIGANTASGYVDVIGVSGNTVTASASGGIGGSVFVRRFLNTVLASGSTYTVSFLMRQTGAHTIGGYWIGIQGIGDVGGGFDVSGSFSSGAIYSAAGATNRIRRVERWGADVYRCSETFTLTASGTLDRMLMGPVVAVNSTSSVASGTQIAFAAPQIELGSVPTSFIPTTTAAVTRNADVISLSGAVSGCIGQASGTVYVEVDLSNRLNGTTAITLAKDANVSGRVIIYTNTSNRWRANYTDASGNVVDTSAANDSQVLGVNKLAFAYGAGGNATVHCNGSLIITLSGTSTFVQELRAVFLGSGNGGSLFFNNRIRAAALYTERLTNEQLAALTAP